MNELQRESSGPDALEGEPLVGDIAIVPYPEVRADVGCAAEAGLLMEDRRNVVRVFFPGMDRTFWLPREAVETVPRGRLVVHPLIDRLNLVARRVDAVLIESDDEAGRPPTYDVYCPALKLDDLLYIQGALRTDLEDMTIEAGSVRRVKLRLVFRQAVCLPRVVGQLEG